MLVFASEAVRERMAEAGVSLAEGEDAGVVFVAHLDEVEMASLERAARAVLRGAPLLTGSYVPGYAGANGMIFSRGAMVTAAIAKVTGARPKVVGKPSRAAMAEVSSRLGVPAQELAVIGDDLGMDIALGRLGGSRTVLVRSGISGAVTLERVPEAPASGCRRRRRRGPPGKIVRGDPRAATTDLEGPMRAALLRAYGEPLELVGRPDPSRAGRMRCS